MVHKRLAIPSRPGTAGPHGLTRNSRLRPALAALLLAVGLTGCGGGGGGSDKPVGGATTGSSNWDQMKWDQDKWS